MRAGTRDPLGRHLAANPRRSKELTDCMSFHAAASGPIRKNVPGNLPGKYVDEVKARESQLGQYKTPLVGQPPFKRVNGYSLASDGTGRMTSTWLVSKTPK